MLVKGKVRLFSEGSFRRGTACPVRRSRTIVVSRICRATMFTGGADRTSAPDEGTTPMSRRSDAELHIPSTPKRISQGVKAIAHHLCTSEALSRISIGGGTGTRSSRGVAGASPGDDSFEGSLLRQLSVGDIDDSALSPAEAVATAYVRRLSRTTQQNYTDAFYSAQVCLRSLPVHTFMSNAPREWALPITSINEDRMLELLGVSQADRNQIEGLRDATAARDRSSDDGPTITEEQRTSSAVARLAANPPPQVGPMQRRTAKWLLRPFPLGLRFSGKNMSPLPCWLGGAQSVCLNMSNVDLSVQLHFALFKGSRGGFVLKPSEMRKPPDAADPAADQDGRAVISSPTAVGERPPVVEADFWPPPRTTLFCTTIDILSLHNLPKRGEERPRYAGSHSKCHQYSPEQSGPIAPPNGISISRPSLKVSVHAIGGFCAISGTLPLPQHDVRAEVILRARDNGMNASFDETVHCVSAEPHATFLRMLPGLELWLSDAHPLNPMTWLRMPVRQASA